MSRASTHVVADDHGQPVTLHAHDLPNDAPKALRKLAKKSELNFSGNLHWTEVAILIGGIILQLFVGFGLQQWMQNAGWSRTNQSIVLGLLLGLTIAAFYHIPFVARSVMRERARRAINAWAQAGLCPACGYDLALDLHKNDVIPDNDGIATCPKCHAHWQAERFNAAIETHAKDWRRQWQESRKPHQPPPTN